MTKLVVIAGPTASGKSDLAIAMAQKFNGEIISADAMQIYRKLDIGTAKVTRAERALVPHHLIDIVDMTSQFSVADFIARADEVIVDIVSRGKLPIITGGTGFYVKALLGEQPLDFVASDEQEVNDLKQRDLSELMRTLQILDSTLAKKVDQHNKQRVIRAIQIARHGAHTIKQIRPKYESLVVGIDWPRDMLYERINSRAQKMIDAGLLAEAQLILDAGGEDCQAGKAIGYKEFFPYLLGQSTLNESIVDMQQDSRRYAKRQLTYLRHQIPGLIWINGAQAKAELAVCIESWV
ncbi:MAG: tRNA (adenosine(37)-N6)-dimethylallyltransferase MiaA [Leuconostoc gelidum]|uniref:tRNA (adenosine(37)-N6)-dimethylallyltransferase MiaA n=1 Tax=Leuconostoc gelidum TaxID=1244 RepID=UPI001575F4F1|nr:tRNA (adenosine(37)-N6)-dimethylallyltransferase MiaA [Leuconostoc gelidum]MBZ5978699.1 tRNA (adenosine(37)-N6)-dimethylallyltransferase MiaA [Leuconostoc gelidum subsp. gelidum]MBZ6000839.1 tRNA (adenosine(37)-N6)-dimethylallyltransferase MiaA [Leuconostoc gelidum subsp. gelidum]QDJ29565.1 tRNA (adenosine(37)-N6)-dimethylallyltransferase MiaA [Leuconostoc gelidum subsp. gelidum]